MLTARRSIASQLLMLVVVCVSLSSSCAYAWEYRLADQYADGATKVGGRYEVRQSSSDEWGYVCKNGVTHSNSVSALCHAAGFGVTTGWTTVNRGSNTIGPVNQPMTWASVSCPTSTTPPDQCTTTTTPSCEYTAALTVV